MPRKGFVGGGARGDPLGMTLEPQPWVLLSKLLNATQSRALLAALARLECPLGYNQARGGHMWAALVHPMLMGLATVNASLALETWKRSSLAHEASLYPTLWPGVWTSADYVRAESGTSGGGLGC